MSDRQPVRPRSSDRRRILVAGVSGPDGAGKSTLVAELGRRLAARGDVVATTYLYGCVICRRLSDPTATQRRASPSGRRSEGGQAGRPPVRLARGLHAWIDAVELWLRLQLALRSLARRTGGSTGPDRLLLTDRSPLDGLAKHAPGSRSLLARVYRRSARRYDVILNLVAPPAVLAMRDPDHAEETLAHSAARFKRFAAWLPTVVAIDATGTPEDVLDAAQEALTSTGT